MNIWKANKYLHLAGILVFLILLANCQQQAIPKTAFPPAEQTNISIDEAAKRIVESDIKQSVTADDIRVKRVKYLLNEMVDSRSLSLYASCNLVEMSVNNLENKKGIKVSKQDYLEAMKKAKDSNLSESLGQEETFLNLASLANFALERK